MRNFKSGLLLKFRKRSMELPAELEELEGKIAKANEEYNKINAEKRKCSAGDKKDFLDSLKEHSQVCFFQKQLF